MRFPKKILKEIPEAMKEETMKEFHEIIPEEILEGSLEKIVEESRNNLWRNFKVILGEIS